MAVEITGLKMRGRGFLSCLVGNTNSDKKEGTFHAAKLRSLAQNKKQASKQAKNPKGVGGEIESRRRMMGKEERRKKTWEKRKRKGRKMKAEEEREAEEEEGEEQQQLQAHRT